MKRLYKDALDDVHLNQGRVRQYVAKQYICYPSKRECPTCLGEHPAMAGMFDCKGSIQHGMCKICFEQWKTSCSEKNIAARCPECKADLHKPPGKVVVVPSNAAEYESMMNDRLKALRAHKANPYKELVLPWGNPTSKSTFVLGRGGGLQGRGKYSFGKSLRKFGRTGMGKALQQNLINEINGAGNQQGGQGLYYSGRGKYHM